MQKTIQEKRTVLPDDLAYADALLQKWKRAGHANKTTLFIGDSFFDSRYFWTDFYTNAFLDIDAIAAGIGGTTTYDWEYLAQTFLAQTAPKNLVVNLGTNNFYDDYDSEEETVAHLQRLFLLLKKLLPQTNLYYFSIAQRTDEAYKAQVAHTNAAMQGWCAQNGITFLPVTDLLTPETLRDGVHPKLEAYSFYLNALKKAGIEYEQKYFLTQAQLKERLAKMSLREKLLELTQYNSYLLAQDGEEKTVTGTSVADGLKLEELWRMGTTLNTNDAEEVNALRNGRKERGIEEPVVVMHDVIHGYRTVYPVPLALACSFDLSLIEDCAHMAAIEARYDGIDVTFSPMVDLVRDARWGRVMESAGEDPYYAGEVGKAFIRGYHKGGIAACVKHFAAYGAAEAGRDYNTTDVSEHTLREYYLRAYRACLDEEPELFMSSFNALNGVPVLGNKQLMVDTLRTEWGFDGVLISDYASVYDMIKHGYCADEGECAKVSLDANLDIEMCSPVYARTLPELLKKGEVASEQIDAAALRVLQLKNKLGLYENPNRYTDAKKRDEVQLSPAHRALALKAAEESCVLLKNEGVLPLKNGSVALVGPFANEKEALGNWGCRGRVEETVSLQEGVERLLGRKVTVAQGCSGKLLSTDASGIPAAVEAAKGAETIVACVGEPMYNSGEGHSRTRIELPPVQKELLRALKTLKKPLVVVVFGGRPQAITEEVELADALLYAWQLGSESGNALANLLFGRAVPCGKTVMSFPRTTGQCPIYYNHFATCRPKPGEDVPAVPYVTGYDDEVNAPLFPFGYGLSYTRFAYSDFRLSADTLTRRGSLTASVRVTNTGNCDGAEVVQWYLRDKFASCVRPVKELKGFERVFLKAGEARTVQFAVTEETLKFYAASGEFKAEAGDFTLFVGGNSRDALGADFQLKD